MIGVDTNVLVRLLVSDDLPQQRRALARITAARAAGEDVLLTTVVLAELAWVLESAYDYDRAAIGSAIGQLLSTEPFTCDATTEVRAALAAYASGKAGFSDHLIVALSAASGCRALVSFDRRLQREPLVEAP